MTVGHDEIGVSPRMYDLSERGIDSVGRKVRIRSARLDMVGWGILDHNPRTCTTSAASESLHLMRYVIQLRQQKGTCSLKGLIPT